MAEFSVTRIPEFNKKRPGRKTCSGCGNGLGGPMAPVIAYEVEDGVFKVYIFHPWCDPEDKLDWDDYSHE